MWFSRSSNRTEPCRIRRRAEPVLGCISRRESSSGTEAVSGSIARWAPARRSSSPCPAPDAPCDRRGTGRVGLCGGHGRALGSVVLLLAPRGGRMNASGARLVLVQVLLDFVGRDDQRADYGGSSDE